MNINLKDFLNSKKILHSDTVKTVNEAYNLLFEKQNDIDIITYDFSKDFLLLGTNTLEKDTKGNYFYEFLIDGDILENIYLKSSSDLKVELSYRIGEQLYSPKQLNQFFTASKQCKLRVTFIEMYERIYSFQIVGKCFIVNLKDIYYLINNITE